MKKILSNKRLFKIIVVLLLFSILSIMGIVYLKGNIEIVVLDSSQAQITALGVSAINQAANTVINNSYTYDDLFLIEYDNNNNVTMIKANSPEINKLARNMATLAQANLEELGIQTIQIPLGTFTGINLLTGYGPAVSINVMPIGRVECDFKSQFIEAGINQTVHKIYIDVKTTISIIMPVKDVDVEISTELLICENLIIGKVPDIYLGGGFSSVMDLIPG